MKKKKGVFEKLFDRAQTDYTKFENNLWDGLGSFGVWMKKRRSRSVPDWKRINNIWIWITILAFVVGCLIAGKYYEYQCNKHIVETFYPDTACRLGLKCDMSDMLVFENNSISLENIPLLGNKNGDIT